MIGKRRGVEGFVRWELPCLWSGAPDKQDAVHRCRTRCTSALPRLACLCLCGVGGRHDADVGGECLVSSNVCMGQNGFPLKKTRRRVGVQTRGLKQCDPLVNLHADAACPPTLVSPMAQSPWLPSLSTLLPLHRSLPRTDTSPSAQSPNRHRLLLPTP